MQVIIHSTGQPVNMIKQGLRTHVLHALPYTRNTHCLLWEALTECEELIYEIFMDSLQIQTCFCVCNWYFASLWNEHMFCVGVHVHVHVFVCIILCCLAYWYIKNLFECIEVKLWPVVALR